jgi:imidazolonepropionase-like amidohydrolase
MDYATPALLQRAGVTIAFQSNDPTLARHFVPNIGLAVAYGLSPDEALRALTINPARMFGVDDRLGSLETGKEATFFLSHGDPLQATSRVHTVFVRGRAYEPRSYQTALCEQYVAPRNKDIPCLPK